MTLSERLAGVRERLQSVPERLGVPQWVPLTIEHGEGTWTWQAIKTTHANPQQVQAFLGSDVIINAEDVEVAIPRTAPEDAVAHGLYTSQGKVWEVLYIVRDKAVTWRVFLTAYRRR